MYLYLLQSSSCFYVFHCLLFSGLYIGLLTSLYYDMAPPRHDPILHYFLIPFYLINLTHFLLLSLIVSLYGDISTSMGMPTLSLLRYCTHLASLVFRIQVVLLHPTVGYPAFLDTPLPSWSSLCLGKETMMYFIHTIFS